MQISLDLSNKLERNLTWVTILSESLIDLKNGYIFGDFCSPSLFSGLHVNTFQFNQQQCVDKPLITSLNIYTHAK